MPELSKAVAQQFFAALYEESPTIPDQPEFDRMATRIVASMGANTSTGDQALQSLMFNYILSSPENVEKGKRLASVLGNIKQKAVLEFATEFPDANLDELIKAAEGAGYDVEVLK